MSQPLGQRPLPLQRVEGLAASPIDLFRLMLLDGVLHLFHASHSPPGQRPGHTTTVIAHRPLMAALSSAPWLQIQRLLPGVVEWDLAPSKPSERLAVAHHFGGGAGWLDVHREGRWATWTDPQSAEDFRDPRFARGAPGPARITAVVDERKVVLLPPPDSKNPLPPRPLVSEETIDSALLLHTAAGPCLLFKRYTIDARRRRFPGVLAARMLNGAGEPAGPVFHPLGQRTIYEFDADVGPRGLAVVATTKEGFLVATGEPARGLDVEAHGHPIELRKPATAWGPAGLGLVFQEFDRGQDGPLVWAQMP